MFESQSRQNILQHISALIHSSKINDYGAFASDSESVSNSVGLDNMTKVLGKNGQLGGVVAAENQADFI